MTLDTGQGPAIESIEKNQHEQPQQGKQSSYFQWFKLNPLRSSKTPPVPQERQVSREYGANLASLITFQWVTPIVKLGYKRELEIQDIWTVNPTRSVSILSNRLDEAFTGRLECGEKRPLAWALYDTLKIGLCIGILCQVLSMCLLVLAPFVVRRLIEFAMDAYTSQHNNLPGPSLGKGMGLVIGLVTMQLVQSLSSNQAFYQSLIAGGQLKAVLTPKMFSKAMRLSGRARAGNRTGYSDGRITTLMAVDLGRLEKGCASLHILCATPIALIIALVTLLVNIGYSALAGYAFLVAITCLLTFAVRSIIVRRRAINTITDKRVSLTQEILQNVRFIKFFAWENSFLQRLRRTRKLEIDSLRRFLATRHSITVSFTSMANFASLLSFMTYVLSGHTLSSDRIFASLAVFNAIRLPLSMMNVVVTSTTDAVTSLNRLQEFLLAEEREDFITWDRNMENAFEFKKASFTWESVPDIEAETPGVDSVPVSASASPVSSWDGATKPASESKDNRPFRIMDIDFQAAPGELIAVIGTIGSGKSSLLGALAGEMRLTAGSVSMSTAPAFCPQYAWIQNTTIRNNILFGQDYDEVRYDQVIDACALRADLATFSDGDQTEIGERGITLSGGQRQRLNIARAIYSNCDIILLDDPLSAVDANVGLHIMNHAICGLLKDRCRILATHQLHVLAHCDRIIVMEAGRVVDIGTFDHLVQKNEVLQSLVSVNHQEKEETPSSPSIADAVQVEKAFPESKLKNGNAAPLMKEEERVRHARRRDIWRAYAVSSGSMVNIFIVFALAVLSAGGAILGGLWLSFWASNRFPQMSLAQYLGIYAGITAGQAAILYLFSVCVTAFAAIASKVMLEDAMHRLLRAPTSFFDTTPLGRIINRFSKDVQVLDSELGEALRLFLYLSLMVVAIMILVIVYFHYFALAVGPLVAIVILLTIYHRASAQSLKRHEAVLRSVVFARFNEAITGIACIRAYNMEVYFRQNIGQAIDSSNAAYFLIFANQRWLSVRLDLVCNTLLLVTGVLVVTSRFNVSPSISGLILSYMLSISQTLQFSIRQYTELEQHINSAERLHHYGTSLEEEEKTAPLHRVEVSSTWPAQGQITFQNVQMRYREELPLVLKGLTMSIQSGERIGVVGRTGAGKSSIVSALFRLTELSGGNIRIDRVDIASIALHDLRSRLAIIPQDPTLFRGTIRSNLDPFDEYTDLELWSALRKAHLVGPPPEAPSDGHKDARQVVNEKAAGTSQLHLDTRVDEGGLNLSLGQRQLMALARAIVRDSKIIICDEATSSLDYQTDQKVQETISGMHGKTLFCIAHRLRTIIHYDRICVMDKGCIAELDTPVRLWEQQGIFWEMCNQSGITREELERGPVGL
ncbi:P-loop containing nucleoside triphosphate hydrolase protein [Aspergillus transmontanensis]|uniref:P-loop containing nucleoside triphosphate hydrolase protein n=1 Tax=Aspergillus transmontanensis TaxID=1034304 RepID=A0A5N6VQ96_9EURO|nr:P-loop containing nucleoside triphosphate hydrolase protein [Aspergillus transmontanensis]